MAGILAWLGQREEPRGAAPAGAKPGGAAPTGTEAVERPQAARSAPRHGAALRHARGVSLGAAVSGILAGLAVVWFGLDAAAGSSAEGVAMIYILPGLAGVGLGLLGLVGALVSGSGPREGGLAAIIAGIPF